MPSSQVTPTPVPSNDRDEQEWNAYWSHQKPGRRLLYDPIAVFYRTCIIKPNLNRFVRESFTPGARLLHAGCGSGQVDTDIRDYASIIALDVSPAALALYRRTTDPQCDAVQASIRAIPFATGSTDGVYNLGVMEHFTEPDIVAILRELRRVLKPGGRLVIFWPPEFGLSVLWFKGLTWLFKTVFRKRDVTFHPPELTRLRSRRHAYELFEHSGLRVVRYAFGARDAFTYCVVVAERTDAVD